MTHYNVQIHVQEVEPKREAKNDKGYLEKGIGGAPIILEKSVKELLTFAVTADTEVEAYTKAMRILDVNRPEPVFTVEPEDPFKQHLHRASCDDSGGNRICGYPPGPSIATR